MSVCVCLRVNIEIGGYDPFSSFVLLPVSRVSKHPVEFFHISSYSQKNSRDTVCTTYVLVYHHILPKHTAYITSLPRYIVLCVGSILYSSPLIDWFKTLQYVSGSWMGDTMQRVTTTYRIRTFFAAAGFALLPGYLRGSFVIGWMDPAIRQAIM